MFQQTLKQLSEISAHASWMTLPSSVMNTEEKQEEESSNPCCLTQDTLDCSKTTTNNDTIYAEFKPKPNHLQQHASIHQRRDTSAQTRFSCFFQWAWKAIRGRKQTHCALSRQRRRHKLPAVLNIWPHEREFCWYNVEMGMPSQMWVQNIKPN